MLVDQERKAAMDQKERDKQFFKEMEANLRASLLRGELVPGMRHIQTQPGNRKEKETILARPDAIRVRTISGMGDKLLTELRDDGNAAQTCFFTQQLIFFVIREATTARAEHLNFFSGIDGAVPRRHPVSKKRARKHAPASRFGVGWRAAIGRANH